MSTVRMGSGLAFTPQRDLDLFAEMAARGQHLSGTTLLGHGWRFQEGPAEEAVFDLTFESGVDQEYFELFAAAGWTHVLSTGDLHVFKAAPGTVPLHTGTESRREELVRNRNRFGLAGAASLVALVLAAWLLPKTGLAIAAVNVVLLPLLVVTIYTVLPFLGFAWHKARFDRRSPRPGGVGGA